MSLSILDLFTIGIGPSSSHTVGPMRAAYLFAHSIQHLPVSGVRCDLFGSLAATGKGHGTDTAILLGLAGEQPESINVDLIPSYLAQIRERKVISISQELSIPFDEKRDLIYHRGQSLPLHSNGLHFTALDQQGEVIAEEIFYSVGGGFVLTEAELGADAKKAQTGLPFSFDSGEELLEKSLQNEWSIADLILANELSLRPEKEIRKRLDKIWQAMQDCVDRGCASDGTRPGGFKVPRRARELSQRLNQQSDRSDPLAILDWVNLFALAVNEENAAGGRVVTAPTNGAAGIIPAVLHYATRFNESPYPDGVHRFLLTAGAIGLLYKKNASISGADVGCQGEVGVACSMAAGGLVEFLGGTPNQVECAAEIGMEHNLGLTCDPVGGLVQIPCIERNAMGSIKAINAARLAMIGDGKHLVSLDKVIKTMRETGRDMQEKYKETSRGGLAVNVVEC